MAVEMLAQIASAITIRSGRATKQATTIAVTMAAGRFQNARCSVATLGL
jgi:hypothetical protein